MQLVQTEDDALKVKAGDQYLIDVYPQPAVTDEEIAGFDKAFEEAIELEQKLQEIIDKNLLPRVYTKTELNRMKEADLVALALTMGIDAKVSDKKADTVQKVLDKQDS